MQPKINPESEDLLFLSPSSKYFKISPLTLKDKVVLSSIVVFKKDTTSIKTLIQKYVQDQKIKLQEGEQIRWRMKGGWDIPIDFTVKQLKQILNDLGCKVFEVVAIVVKTDSASKGQENVNQKMKLIDDPNFKSPQSDSNKLQICFEFPQFKKTLYEKIPLNVTLAQTISQIIDKHKLEFVQTCSTIESEIYKITIKNGDIEDFNVLVGDVLQAQDIVFVKYLKVLFQEKADLHKKTIKLFNTAGTQLIKLNYSDVKGLKVQTILHTLNVDEFDCLGIKVMDVLIKPYESFAKLEDMIKSKVELPDLLDGVTVLQSQIFYNQIENLKKKFKATEIKMQKKNRQNLQKISSTRIKELKDTAFKQQKIVNPIIYYTSPYCYESLNKFLRQNNFSQKHPNQYDCWQYKFTSALVDSLNKLPNYEGQVYRGTKFRDPCEVGETVCFRAFSSTSTKRECATMFGTKTLYSILTLTGKMIKNFSYYQAQEEVLLLPYTYFRVLSVNLVNDVKEVKLLQLPFPNKRNANILFWVDDCVTQGNFIHNNLIIKYPNLRTQFVQLISNEHLQMWMEEFRYLTLNKNIKVTLISDMRRNEQNTAGIETIKLSQKLLGEQLETFFYVGNLESTINTLHSNGLKLCKTLMVGNKREEVTNFILNTSLAPQELSMKYEGKQCCLI